MRKHILTACAGVCVSLLLFSGGCGKGDTGGRVGVSGTVTFKGQPLDQGSIEFSPASPDLKTLGGGMISGGQFRLGPDRGLAPGKYLVRISSSGAAPTGNPSEAPGVPPPPTPDRIPAEFNTQSKQEVTVTANGPNKFEFKIP